MKPINPEQNDGFRKKDALPIRETLTQKCYNNHAQALKALFTELIHSRTVLALILMTNLGA